MTARDLEGFVGVDPWLTNCDRAPAPRAHERVTYAFCACCQRDAIFPVTIAGLGVFCSTRCAEAAKGRA